jgi:hypothetical protein
MRAIETIQKEASDAAPSPSPAAKPKRKRGRPRIPDASRLSRSTWFLSSAAEHQDYAREAKRMRVPLRVWIRLSLNATVAAARAARKDS